MSDLMLDVDQAGELKAAFRRGDWTNSQIKELSEGNFLTRVRLVLEDKAEIVIKKILTFVKSITTSAIAGKKTRDCFTDKSRYSYRDSDLDAWLPKDQPDQPESKFSVQQLLQSTTFKQAVESFLGITGEISVLAQALKAKGCVTTLPTIESLIERHKTNEDVGLNTNSYANFFFVEDKDGSVSVVSVYRIDLQCFVFVNRLVSGAEWNAGNRFFFRNLDPLSL